MYSDIESGSAAVQQSKSFKRKWKSLPRFVKLYISIGICVTIFVAIVLIMPKTSVNTTDDTSDDSSGGATRTRNNVVVLNNYNLFNTDINDQLLKPISDRLNAEQKIKLSDDTSDEERARQTGDTLTAKMFRISAQNYENAKQKAIKDAFKHSWNGYKKYAWGSDNLKPLTKTKHDWFGVGLTLLDGLDTAIVMGLNNEYEDALMWITNDLRFDIHKEVNCFEMTIRALGGLLSAYHLSGDPNLLLKAADVGDRLIHCFDTPYNLVPFSDVNLKTKIPKTPNWSPDSSLSEVSSVQLEFRDLSYLTGIDKYEKLSFRVSEHLHNITLQSGDSLLPMFINPHTGRFSRGTITLGARADSYYEYLLKQYFQTGINWLKEDYVKAIDAINKRLLRTTNGPLKLAFIGEILRSSGSNEIHPKMDHLVCFLSGTLALGYYHELLKSPNVRGHNIEENSQFSEHLAIAEKLARTCYMMYNTTATGLSPEIAYFGETTGEDELQIRPADAHNLQRPEFVESLFYLYHITGNQIYRDWGWKVFEAFERYTKVSTGGYVSISDVRNADNVRPRDMQESFWLSETLKYLYLLFCDDKQIINKLLDNYVFNTEGHLFPRRV